MSSEMRGASEASARRWGGSAAVLVDAVGSWAVVLVMVSPFDGSSPVCQPDIAARPAPAVTVGRASSPEERSLRARRAEAHRRRADRVSERLHVGGRRSTRRGPGRDGEDRDARGHAQLVEAARAAGATIVRAARPARSHRAGPRDRARRPSPAIRTARSERPARGRASAARELPRPTTLRNRKSSRATGARDAALDRGPRRCRGSPTPSGELLRRSA
jgi:hypothetical protein